jgi:hypothetical protein
MPTEPIDPKLAILVTGTPRQASRTVRAEVLATRTWLSTPGRSPSQSSWTIFSMPPGAGG